MKNSGTPIFQNTEGSFILIDCSVDPEDLTNTVSTSLEIQEIGIHSFINGINLLQTAQCEASYDLMEGVELIPENNCFQTFGLSFLFLKKMIKLTPYFFLLFIIFAIPYDTSYDRFYDD